MIILLGKDGKYGMGNDFPIFTLPLDMENATSQSLEDYQWWAYSSDFKKWLDKNPRQWVADSEDTTKYSEMSQLIREYFEGRSYPSLLESESSEGRVLKFGDYVSSYEPIYEDNSSDSESEKKTVKFHFAYNKLLSEGKLDTEFSVAEQKEGQDKAVFLSLETEQGENDMSTLDAYKMAPMKGGNPDAKFVLFEIKDRKLAGPIDEKATGASIVEDALKTGVKTAAYGAAALVIWTGVKYAGGAFAARRAWKQLTTAMGKGAATKSAPQASKYWRYARRYGKKGLKTLWGNAKNIGMDIATLKSLRAAGSATSRGVKGAKAAYTLGKAGVGGALKAFGKGASRGFAKAGGKAIPLVGEVLMVIDAVGSTWNWYSGNQAPRYGEVEDFAKETFDPKTIEIGVPITICWSQPAGGWGGTAVSFLFSNETRTTMELVKVAEVDNKSIFILTQINSKEVQKQISKSDVTLLAFDNSDPVERGWIDNEDLDFEMASYSQDLTALFNYQGSCDWNEFEDEFNNSSETLLISDPDSPQEYEFHFKDSEDEVINVIGRKVTDEELSKYSDSDISRIFGIDTEVKPSKDSNIDVAEETKEEKEKAEVVEDGLDNSNHGSLIGEARAITSFSDFKRGITSIIVNEDEETDKDLPEITAEQKSGPAKVSVYLVTEKDYANPELRGKYIPGKFTNFIVDGVDLKAREGDSIQVDVNTNEVLEDEVRGLYKYVAPKEDKEGGETEKKTQATEKDDEESETKTGSETETKSDDYYFTVSPEDVEIKDKKNSTAVKDTSLDGGVNLFDKLLTPRDKETLKIENWKTVTFAKEIRDNRGDVIEVKFRNKYAPFGDKSRRYRAIDGDAFELAKKFVEEAKDRIKYE